MGGGERKEGQKWVPNLSQVGEICRSAVLGIPKGFFFSGICGLGTFSFLEHARHENRREGEGHLGDHTNSGIEHPYQNLPTSPASSTFP